MSMEKTIKMVGTRVLMEMYEENPYERNETENGFKLTKGEFDNPDSGERDTKNPGVVCAKVVAAGAECKYCKEGDDIFIPVSQIRPLVINDKVYGIAFEENALLIFD